MFYSFGMETIETIPCGGCGHSMQWMYEHSPWGIARFVTCWRCDDPRVSATDFRVGHADSAARRSDSAVGGSESTLDSPL